MTIQLKRVLLYSLDGRIRRVPFAKGRVNVITGASNTGKSSIIAIVEYCFGRSEFNVPEGIISDSVAWYGVVFTVASHEILVAKPAPKEGKQSQSEIFFDEASEIVDPDFERLVPNSNDDALVEYLTRAQGIVDNFAEVPDGSTRDALHASIKHTRYYLFQDQGTVASEKLLFHRQAEPFMPQAIRDTLPYFLGAYDDERVRLSVELRVARRALKAAEQELRESEDAASWQGGRAWDLLSEARAAGLVAKEASAESRADVVALLAEAAKWSFVASSGAPQDDLESPSSLRARLRASRMRLQHVNDRLQAANELSHEASAYSMEASVQRGRLECIELLPAPTDTSVCPLCLCRPAQESPTLAEVRKSILHLDRDLSLVAQDSPQLAKHVEALRAQRDEVIREVRRAESDLGARVKIGASSSELFERDAIAARVAGRLSLFVEANAVAASGGSLESAVAEKRARLRALEQARDSNDDAERLASALSWISAQMTAWAERLQLEFRGQPYRFDLKNLTVVADRDGRPVPLGKRMGGGENWLGCHLISLFALHKFFVKNDRPVPRFLILDQPTQVYFPPERYARLQGDPAELLDEDRTAVKRMYDFLFAVADELEGAFQIIVLDHANLGTSDFQAALVEEPWRDGRALVPKSWTERET